MDEDHISYLMVVFTYEYIEPHAVKDDTLPPTLPNPEDRFAIEETVSWREFTR